MSDDQTSRILAIVERLETGQASLETRLVNLETGQASLEARLVNLETGQAKLEAGQAGLEAKLVNLETGQAKLETGQTRLRVDVMARMDRLQDGLTAIRDDVSTNYGTAEAVQRANDNTRSELRALSDVVSSLVRQIRRLDNEVRILKGDGP